MACGINDTLLAGAFDNLNCYARAQFEAACCIDGSSVIPGCEGAIQWAGHGQFLAYFRNATYIFYSLMVILFGLIVLWQLGWNVLGCCGWNSESGGMWAGMTTVPILNRRYWGWSVFGLYAVSAAIGVALYMLIAPKNTTGQYLKWHGSPNAAYSTMLTLSLLLFTFGVICLLMPFRRIHHTHFTLIKGLWLILSGAMVLTLAWPIPDESRARVQTIGAILWVAAGVWAILTVPLLRWRYGEYAYADETILDVYSVPVSSNDITFRKSIRYKDTLKPMATSIVWFDGLNAVLVSTMAALDPKGLLHRRPALLDLHSDRGALRPGAALGALGLHQQLVPDHHNVHPGADPVGHAAQPGRAVLLHERNPVRLQRRLQRRPLHGHPDVQQRQDGRGRIRRWCGRLVVSHCRPPNTHPRRLLSILHVSSPSLYHP
jgi:hypothetical protein